MVKWCRDDSVVYNTVFKRYVVHINDLTTRDYASSPFSNNYASLDLDRIESDSCGNNECTMDCAIGIGQFNGVSFRDSRLFLLELRLGFLSSDSFDRTSMYKKVEHSKTILKDYIIHNQFAFIFDNTVVNQAKYWIKNHSYQYSYMKSWLALNVSALESFVGRQSDFPYVPITDVEQMKIDLLNLISSFDSLWNKTDFWKNKLYAYRNRYNLAEVSAIKNALIDVWSRIVKEKLVEESNLSLAELILEDINNL